MKVVTEQEVEGIVRGGLRNNKQQEIGNGYVPEAKLYLYIFFLTIDTVVVIRRTFYLFCTASPSTGI